MSQITKTISPDNNIYYFNGNIDVRICPKNAMTTIKHMAWQFEKLEETAIHRVKMVREKCDRINPPFRKGSIRYAIKRDPIERFLSAYRFLKKDYANTISIDQTLDKLETGDHDYEPHYMSQSYFLGVPEDYDHVYDIKDTNKILNAIWYNRSTTEDDSILESFVQEVHMNKTHDQKHLGAFDVTDEQRDRILELYDIDYKRGWHGH